MHKLGPAVAPTTTAVAINNRGQVIGEGTTASGAIHAFVWERRRLTDLGTLGGNSAAAAAVALNDRGQVVGMSTTPRGAVQIARPRRVLVWRAGRIVQVGPLQTFASAINDLGQVVGRYRLSQRSTFVPYIWRNGRLTPLPELDGVGPPYGGAYALNDHGWAVGDSYTDVGGHTFDHAVMWTPRP